MADEVMFGTPETWGLKVGEFIETQLPQEKPQELLDLQEQNRKQRLLNSLQKIGPGLMDESLNFIRRKEFDRGGVAKVLAHLDTLPEGTDIDLEYVRKYIADNNINASAKNVFDQLEPNKINRKQIAASGNETFTYNKEKRELLTRLNKKLNRVKVRTPVPPTKENLEKLDNLIKNTNLNTKGIAEAMGFGKESFSFTRKNPLITEYLKKYGPPPEGRFKERLTADSANVKKAIELKELGLSNRQIGDELGVDRNMIPTYFRKGGRDDLVGEVNVKKPGSANLRFIERLKKIKEADKFASESDKVFNKAEDKRVRTINKYVKENAEELANNKKIQNLINLKLDTKGNILSKEKTPEEITKSIKRDRFFERDHISSVAKKKRSMQFPVNFQIAPYNINQGFFNSVETYAKRPDADPAKLEKISKVLDEYGLRLDTGKGIIGAKQIPASQVIDRNLNALDLPTDLGKPFKPGMQPDGQLKDLPGGQSKGFLGGEEAAKAAGRSLLTALKVLGQPSIAAGIAADDLRQGNIKTGGAALLAPELVGSFAPAGRGILSTIGRIAANPFGKAARAFTPVGAATIGAGALYDVYKEYERRQALTDEERLEEDIERDRAADEMMIGAAEGGRIGFADGPKDPSKRKFMKLMGIMSLLPFGIGKGFKMLEKTAPVVAEGAKLGFDKFMMLVNKIKELGTPTGKVTQKEREMGYTYTGKDGSEYELIEDLTTGDLRVTKDKPGVAMGGDKAYDVIEDRSTFVLKKGQADETTKGKTPPDEYDEVKEVASPDGTFDDVDEISDKAVKEVLDEIN